MSLRFTFPTLDPAWMYASKTAFTIPFQSSHLIGSRPSSSTAEKTGAGANAGSAWYGTMWIQAWTWTVGGRVWLARSVGEVGNTLQRRRGVRPSPRRASPVRLIAPCAGDSAWGRGWGHDERHLNVRERVSGWCGKGSVRLSCRSFIIAPPPSLPTMLRIRIRVRTHCFAFSISPSFGLEGELASFRLGVGGAPSQRAWCGVEEKEVDGVRYRYRCRCFGGELGARGAGSERQTIYAEYPRSILATSSEPSRYGYGQISASASASTFRLPAHVADPLPIRTPRVLALVPAPTYFTSRADRADGQRDGGSLAGCTEAGMRGYSSTEVGSCRGASRCGRANMEPGRCDVQKGGRASARAFSSPVCWGLGAEFFLPESAHRPGAGTVGLCSSRTLMLTPSTDPISTPPPPSSEPSRIQADQCFRIHIRLAAHVAVPLHTPIVPILVPSHSEPTGWAIWSRRLRDPAHAPGAIISLRAAAARHGGTPSLLPPPVPAEQEGEEGVGEGVVHISLEGRVEEGAEEAVVEREAPVLILHVKGFCYDTAVGGVLKVGKRVAFGPELEVENGSFVYHYGVSSSGGHYTLDVLHPTRFPGSSAGTGSECEGWVRIDDELVSDVRPVDVFGAPEGDSLYGCGSGSVESACLVFPFVQ
ncbi:hypothetical protein DFH08DRAFT_945134 [Mycena albidolilacea]|uniref:Uncharacterized protein n=1 Tax=Mycena albidolilacea TaxID=1033008 RepID=A0AAD6Z311_9AGAR|nr:hypothetical protein DFH08DRAFT_945134 [Mycena albidolilacea]